MLPEIDARSEFAAVVIRTDYGDETAWAAVATELGRPWGTDGEFEAGVHFVDDPVRANAGPDDIVAAVRRGEEQFVVFVADRHTMRSADHALLALDTRPEDQAPDPIGAPSPRAFRTVPAGVHEVQANPAIANLFFSEFAQAAHAHPEGVFRAFGG